MYVAIYIDLQRPPWPVPNDFHAEEVMQFAEVIHLVVRLDAIDNSFDGSAASSGDHTVVHVRENVDRMSTDQPPGDVPPSSRRRPARISSQEVCPPHQ